MYYSMNVKRMTWSLALSFLLSLVSLLVTALFNEMGTPSSFTSESMEADWGRFEQQYPTKDIYTMDELNARGAEIRRIQDKYKHQEVEHVQGASRGHLFLRDTAIRSLKINIFIWLAVPALLGSPVRGGLALAVFPIAFSAVGLFYAFETIVFMSSYILGALCGVCWKKLRRKK